MSNMGVASGVMSYRAQIRLEDVMIQSQSAGNTDFREHKDQGFIGAEGGFIYIEDDNGERIASARVEPGFLKEQVVVTLAEEAYEAPPDRYDYLKEYDDEVVTQIGPQVWVSFPSSAINLASEAELRVLVKPYDNLYDGRQRNLYESQFFLGDGRVYFDRYVYRVEITPTSLRGTSVIISGDLHTFPPFTDNLPETYQLIVQPLSVTRP
ncbi:MAG: hypothetical protein AAF267_20725 [Deinococcota bacterium]